MALEPPLPVSCLRLDQRDDGDLVIAGSFGELVLDCRSVVELHNVVGWWLRGRSVEWITATLIEESLIPSSKTEVSL